MKHGILAPVSGQVGDIVKRHFEVALEAVVFFSFSPSEGSVHEISVDCFCA